MRVFVYFNLHKKCWSIKALEGPEKGRVVLHAETAMLYNVQFKVSEAGRQRVLRTKRKNVHAGVVGDMLVSFSFNVFDDVELRHHFGNWYQVTYNPYQMATFQERGTGMPLHVAQCAILSGRKLYARDAQ